jgi:signal transduction histidine kinase
MAGETGARLSVKHLLLLLVSMVVPAIVLVVLGVRLMLQQDQLSEKYRADQVRLQITEFERVLTARLDRAMRDPSDPAIALTATMVDGRLILPWDVPVPGEGESAAFDGAMTLAEREEFRDGRVDVGLLKLETVAALARSDRQRAYVRLVRARMLAKAHRRPEADREYRALLAVPAAVVDQDGMPFALYAAERLLAAGDISDLDRGAIEATVDAVTGVALPPSARYLLRDVDAGLHRVAGTTSAHQGRLAEAIGELEHALTLQRDIRVLASSWETARGAWLPHGKPLWLLGVRPADSSTTTTVIAVRADRLSADTRASRLVAGADEGEWLGTQFPGVKVRLSPLEATPVGLTRAFSAAALAIVLALTLFGGYLLWRDVEREMRLAALRSQFVSSVSHELKTPLTAIRMFAETLLLNRTDASTRTEYLETIVNETERLTRLLNNVLDFSKIEEGRKIYRREPTALASIVQAAARAIEYPLAQHGFVLNVEVEEGLPPVQVDADALEQAILNLLTNAMKYSGRGRRISLRLSRADGDAVIAVADDGIGIPAAEQARIFEKFYRVQTAESQRIPGTGLGLTLVDHIVRAHDGSIHVDSAPGRGSVFAIRLPIVPSTGGLQPAEATS